VSLLVGVASGIALVATQQRLEVDSAGVAKNSDRSSAETLDHGADQRPTEFIEDDAFDAQRFLRARELDAQRAGEC
jgi:hypothetical protein